MTLEIEPDNALIKADSGALSLLNKVTAWFCQVALTGEHSLLKTANLN